MHDHPITIRHHDGRRQDLPSAVDAEIYAPRGHVGSLAEIVAKADAYDQIASLRLNASRHLNPLQWFHSQVSRVIRREQAERIGRDIEHAERLPELVADAR